MSETQPQTDPSPPKGQTSARGGRGRHHYEGGRKRGEEEGERKERKDGGRKEREREEITLDTVIPEKPKKSELLKEPSEDEYEKKYEEITNQIDTLHEKYHRYVKEMEDNKVKNKDKTQTSSMPLKEILKTKIEEKKKLNDEFRVGREMAEKLKNDIDSWHDESQKYRKKLTHFTKAEIDEEIKRRVDIQEREKISISEEKQIIKEIAELRKSLAFVTPLEITQKKMDDARVERKKLVEQNNLLFTQLKKLNDEIDELKRDLDSMAKEKEEFQKSVDPIIQAKREELKTKTDELREQRKKLTDKYNNDWQAFEQQQKLLKRIDFLTKVKNRLKREEERKKEEEELKKQEEEEKKQQVAPVPYEDEIQLCDLLINYAQSLLPKEIIEKPQEVKKDLGNMQEQWQKEKITIVQSKRDQDNDFFIGKGKKKEIKKTQEKQKKTEEISILPLNHQVEVLGFFEKLKVAPPLTVSKLEETIKLLNEKKNYFKQAPAEEKKEGEEEDKNKGNANQKNARKNKEKIDVTESEFPSF